MTEKPHPRLPFAGPRALAVLSCALALLTAQPWAAHAAESIRPAAIRSESTSTQAAPSKQLQTQPLNSSPTAALAIRRELDRAQAQARLQATWAILHQWLLTQLTAHTNVRFDLADSLDLALHTPVQFVAPIIVASLPSTDQSQTTSPPSERQFAIEHLLLSPPC